MTYLRPNIVLIVLDTMREDGLGVYSPNSSTPNIEKLSESSVIYGNVISPSSWTIPSHISFFTGLYPSEHAIHQETFLTHKLTNSKKLRERYLPFVLSSMGYRTIGISANNLLSKELGFDFGFDTFVNIESHPTAISKKERQEATKFGDTSVDIIKNLLKKGKLGQTAKYAVTYLKDRELKHKLQYPRIKGGKEISLMLSKETLNAPFFLFLNFIETHEPYEAEKKGWFLRSSLSVRRLKHYFGEEKIPNSFKSRIKEDYLEECLIVDKFIGDVLRKLKLYGVFDDTLIILTSDHGQSLGEHKWWLHDSFLYEEMIRVPLLIKYPKNIKNHNIQSKENNKSYYSTVDLYDLMIDTAEHHNAYLQSRESVFSEVFDGTNHPLWTQNKRYMTNKDDFELLISKKKTIYKGGYKLTVNGKLGTVIEFLFEGRSIELKSHMKSYLDLLSELEVFCGNEDFRLPVHSLSED